MRSSRVKKLTPKAMEIYKQKVADYSARFESSSDNLKAIIQKCDNVSSDTPIHIIDAIRQSLLQEFDAFEKVFAEFSQYLLQTGTEDSISENLTLFTKYTTKYIQMLTVVLINWLVHVPLKGLNPMPPRQSTLK